MSAQQASHVAPFLGIGTSYFIDEIIDRLSAGESAQDLLKDVVEYVTSDKPCSPLVMADFIIHLADHGARVATDDPDCALQNLVAKRYCAGPALYPAVYKRLVGRPGELPFHILSRLIGGLDLSQKDLDDPKVLFSLRIRDDHGRTLSHWLWDEPCALADQALAVKQLAGSMFGGDMLRNWRSSIQYAWKNQQYLQDLGVGMEIPDHNGVTALELCAARIAEGSALLNPSFDVCRMVEAHISHSGMCVQTLLPPASSPSLSGPRL